MRAGTAIRAGMFDAEQVIHNVLSDIGAGALFTESNYVHVMQMDAHMGGAIH